MLTLKRTLFLTLTTLSIGARADADTMVRFKVSAVGPGGTAGGEGMISFAEGLTTVGIGDLTAFTFDASVFDFIHGGPQFFNYSSSSLKTFSATLMEGPSGPALTGLSLSTSPLQIQDDPEYPELSFNIGSLATDGAFMERWESGVAVGSYATGTFTILEIVTGVAPVPEPSGVVTLGLGAVGLGLAWRRRRRAA